MRKASLGVCLLTLFVIFLSACKGTKNTVYFRKDTPPDTTVLSEAFTPHPDAIIQSGDVLAVSIASLSFAPEDKPSMIFLNGGLPYSQMTSVGNNGGGGSSSNNSYLVDSSGFIDFPRIGRLQMGGLTINAAKAKLATLLNDYLKSPVVEIRILNYRVIMLGSISSPGPLYTSNHKLNILDAIASAGGIPITGRKDNVLIIREVDGKREFARLDLNSRNVFHSPFYYLHQNDIVYVEPSGVAKQEGNEFLRIYMPNILSMMGLIFSIYALVELTKD